MRNNKILLDKTYVHPECMEHVIERWEDNKEGDDAVMPNFQEWWYDTEVFSLQDILSAIPADTDPNKVVISIHRDRAIEDINIKVSIKP